jgi:heat shock protein HslJ
MGCAPGTSLLVERGTGRDDHMRAFSALMLAAAALAAPAWAVTRTLEVDSRLVECTGVAPMQCMRVRDAGETDWRVFHGQIENFAFEPGYRYLLQVEELPVANPPADGGSIRTVLVEMMRKLAVEPPADPFAGKVWRLHELQPRGDAELLRPEAMITLAIDTPVGKASGKGGCNGWFATAKVHGRELGFTGMGATMMACPPPAMDEERAFFAAIGRTQGYAVDEHGLTLTLSDGGVMRFRELID